MVEDVFNAEHPERQRNKKNVVRGITALDDIEAIAQKNPGRVQQLEQECAGVLAQVTQRLASLKRHRMTVNTHSINDLITLRTALALGAKYGHIVSVSVERLGLSPDSRIQRNGLILYNH